MGAKDDPIEIAREARGLVPAIGRPFGLLDALPSRGYHVASE
jgi:hypothetical protein